MAVFAYVTNEENAGTVTALAIDKDGAVRVLITVSSTGRQPTHATLSPDKFLFVANYSVAKGGAGVTVLPIGGDGKLGERVQHFSVHARLRRRAGRAGGGPCASTTFSRDAQYLYARRISARTSCAPTAIARTTRSLCKRMFARCRFRTRRRPRHGVLARKGIRLRHHRNGE
ncbi:lactonase family protein [Serratia ureilytica]